MSSSDHEDESPKKKYKSWLENDTVSVPLRTIQRWQSKTGDANIPITNHDNSNLRTSGSSINFPESDIENLDSDDVTISSTLTSENGSEIFDVESNHADNTSSSDSFENESDSNDMNNREDDSNNDHQPRCQNSKLDLLLYKNSRMTLDESILTLLELYVQHKWTKASLKDTLKMLHKMLPNNNKLPKTVFKLFQYVQNLAPLFSIIKHFYCKKCLNYCSADTRVYECFSCNANDKSISCFFEIDICKQIKYLFEKRNLAEKLKPLLLRPDNGQINDITDGSEYIRVNSREDKQKYDLTLVLNTDGLSLVKSAKSHCWPLMFIIAELPEHLRESFLITIGLWYDNSCKPLMNTFLKPFCVKLERCFQEGISWIHPRTKETFVTRVVAPLIIADAPARAQLQNILNFNGRYGCNICEIKMKQAKNINGQKTFRIYPFPDQNKKLRTGQRMQAQAQKLLRTGDVHVKGVKGHSIISNLPLLDLGTCLLPEYMHSVLLGVGRQFIQLCTQKNNEPWSLKNYIKDIDKFLLNIRPPHFFNRMPRPITDCKFYKASEYYNLIIFYSLPAMVNYWPDEYLQHWILFVKGLFILLQENIKTCDLENAKILLRLFVKQIERLYGDRQLTYNVHQLLHLPLVVERWGPLWATSAFPFENFNGFLAKCVHGTKHFGQEMINNLRIAQGVQILRSQVNVTKLSKDKKTSLLGKGMTINDSERELLISYNVINLHSLVIYVQAKIENEIYTSTMYKNNRTNSYTVQLNLIDNSIVYGAIRFFFKMDNILCFVINCFTVEHCKMFYHPKEHVKIDHIIPIKENNNSLLLIKTNLIRSMQHVIRVGDYICKRPNRLKKKL